MLIQLCQIQPKPYTLHKWTSALILGKGDIGVNYKRDRCLINNWTHNTRFRTKIIYQGLMQISSGFYGNINSFRLYFYSFRLKPCSPSSSGSWDSNLSPADAHDNTGKESMVSKNCRH